MYDPNELMYPGPEAQPQQAPLPPDVLDPWTPADQNWLRQLTGARGEIRKQVAGGVLSPQEGMQMAEQIDALRLPQLARQHQAKQARQNEAVGAVLQQAALLEGIDRQHALARAAAFPATVTEVHNPYTGEVTQFYQPKTGEWAPVEKQDQAEAGAPEYTPAEREDLASGGERMAGGGSPPEAGAPERAGRAAGGFVGDVLWPIVEGGGSAIAGLGREVEGTGRVLAEGAGSALGDIGAGIKSFAGAVGPSRRPAAARPRAAEPAEPGATARGISQSMWEAMTPEERRATLPPSPGPGAPAAPPPEDLSALEEQDAKEKEMAANAQAPATPAAAPLTDEERDIAAAYWRMKPEAYARMHESRQALYRSTAGEEAAQRHVADERKNVEAVRAVAEMTGLAPYVVAPLVRGEQEKVQTQKMDEALREAGALPAAGGAGRRAGAGAAGLEGVTLPDHIHRHFQVRAQQIAQTMYPVTPPQGLFGPRQMEQFQAQRQRQRAFALQEYNKMAGGYLARQERQRAQAAAIAEGQRKEQAAQQFKTEQATAAREEKQSQALEKKTQREDDLFFKYMKEVAAHPLFKNKPLEEQVKAARELRDKHLGFKSGRPVSAEAALAELQRRGKQ